MLLEAAGWALIAIDVANFMVSPGPDVGIAGAAMVTSARAARATAPRAVGAAESAFSVAARGGRHAGFLRQAQGMTPAQLERTARHLQQGISRHQGYLQKPASHVPNWSTLRPQHQQNLIRHWNQEIRTFSEQQSIVMHLLMP